MTVFRGKRTAVLLLLSLLLAMCLTGCGTDGTAEIASAVGLTLPDAAVMETTDTHGGFHGDGTLFCAVDCSAAPAAEQIKANEYWHRLPLKEPLAEMVYGGTRGDTTYAPMLTDENGQSVFPPVERGWYFFLDRHAEATDVYDPSGVEDRYSYNFTLALYDEDTDMLYCFELDT